MLPELPDRGVLQLSPLAGDLDENQSAVCGALVPGHHLARFETVHSLCHGGRLEIHASGEFADRNALVALRQQIQRHELRRTQARLLESIEVGCLYRLPNRKPRAQKSSDLVLIHPRTASSHLLILPDPAFTPLFWPAAPI